MNIENNLEEKIKSTLLGRTKDIEADEIRQTDPELIPPSEKKTEENSGAEKLPPPIIKKI